ncbi:MAG: hypothetical protein R3D43_15125 [Tepidamorphaceae bacterium]
MAIIQSLGNFLDELKAVGAIIDGRAFWDRDLNSNESLQSGILRVEFDAEEAPPLQDLQFGSRRNVLYFDTLAADILEASTSAQPKREGDRTCCHSTSCVGST